MRLEKARFWISFSRAGDDWRPYPWFRGSSYVHHATNMNGEPLAVKVVRANATPDGLTERVMTEINNPLGPSPHIVKPIDHLVLPSYGLHVPCLLFPFINADEVGKFLNQRTTEQRRIGSSP